MDLARWNEQGRDKNQRVCRAFDEIIDRGGSTDEDLAEDGRSTKLADGVLSEVVASNAKGEWQQARQRFDPAHGPFVPHMEQTPLGLSAVSVLGEATFLVRRGTADQQGPVLHIDGGQVQALENVLGFGISRNRRWLALATRDGITVSPGWGASNAQSLAWPGGKPSRPHNLDVSDDGQTLLIASDAAGVWCARGGRFRQLFPRAGIDPISKADHGQPDAIHAALSPDGTLVALGWQDAPGHYVERITGERIERIGVMGTLSDTPYHVRFTDDSATLLSNTRHMQSGVTASVRVHALQGTEEYDDVPDETSNTDEYLRAYGMTLLPGTSLGHQEPVAWIGGAGWSHAAPLSGGKPAFTQFFGSALYALDYSPVVKLAAVASASGMLHVLDPSALATPGTERGYRPRRELYRWIFWDTLKVPIRW